MKLENVEIIIEIKSRVNQMMFIVVEYTIVILLPFFLLASLIVSLSFVLVNYGNCKTSAVLGEKPKM